MTRWVLALVFVLAPVYLLFHTPTPTHAQEITVVTETVRLTYYYPTGNTDKSGHWPVEGYSAGCGYDVPLMATITLASGKEMQCRDRGGTNGPWIDFYVESSSYGWYLIYTEAGGWCEPDTGRCYAVVTFTY